MDKARMGELHEASLAEVFDGRQTRGSGNQWANQGDGTNDRGHFAFRWDGKSTGAASITLMRSTFEKIREQAHGQRPAIGIRFYGDERYGVVEDWTAFENNDAQELLFYARVGQECTDSPVIVADRDEDTITVPREQFQQLQEQARRPVMPVEPHLVQEGPREPRVIVISLRGGDGRLVHQGLRLMPGGVLQPFPVSRCTIESAIGAASRFMVNDVLIHHGELFIDGLLVHSVG